MNTIQNPRRISRESWRRLLDSAQYDEDDTVIVENDLWEEADSQGLLLKRRKGRLRISPDGVEVNGVPLKLTGILFHLM